MKVRLIPEGLIHEVPRVFINPIGAVLVRREDLKPKVWETRNPGTYEIIEGDKQ